MEEGAEFKRPDLSVKNSKSEEENELGEEKDERETKVKK